MLLRDRGHPRTAGGQPADMPLLLLFHLLCIIQSLCRMPCSFRSCLGKRARCISATSVCTSLHVLFLCQTNSLRSSRLVGMKTIINITTFFPNLWRFLSGIPHHLVQGAGFLSRTLPSTCESIRLMAALAEHMCRFCALHYPEAEGRLHGNSFECKSCATSEKMLRRNLGSAACRKPFSPKESAAFFWEIAKQKAAAPKGRLQWNTIRGTLVKQLTDQKVTSFKASVSGKSLPLNVWLQKGYRQEVVEGCPNYRCPDIKDQVYQVPVKEVKWSEEHSKIEAQILQHEQEAAKKKTTGKRKSKDAASSDGVGLT